MDDAQGRRFYTHWDNFAPEVKRAIAEVYRRFQDAGAPGGDTPSAFRRFLEAERQAARVQRPPSGLGQGPR